MGEQQKYERPVGDPLQAFDAEHQEGSGRRKPVLVRYACTCTAVRRCCCSHIDLVTTPRKVLLYSKLRNSFISVMKSEFENAEKHNLRQLKTNAREHQTFLLSLAGARS